MTGRETLPDRLRSAAFYLGAVDSALVEEAAAEIESLRASLETVADAAREVVAAWAPVEALLPGEEEEETSPSTTGSLEAFAANMESLRRSGAVGSPSSRWGGFPLTGGFLDETGGQR